MLRGTDVKVGTVVGFPHGSRLTATKVFEARRALERRRGARHGHPDRRLRSGRDEDVQADIAAVVPAHEAGAIVKVIFENAYLTDDEKIRACRLTEAAGGDFVKTSTGYAATGATHEDLRSCGAHIATHPGQGGRRGADPRRLLEVMNLGVTRVGATQPKTILEDFRARRDGASPVASAAADDGSY